MRWFAIHHELSTNPKWLTLSMDERGAWISLLTTAAAADERGTLRDRTTAAALLQREMGQASVPAKHLIDSLIAVGLVDEDDESGALTFHDFDEWQLRIKKPSDWPDAIRERVQRHRRRQKEKQKEERDLDREVEVTPSNALPPATNGHGPCPDCGAPVVSMTGSRGPFYGCSNWDNGSGCGWKSNAPPKPPPKLFVPDWDEINRVHGKVRAPS